MSQKNWDKYEVALLIEAYQNIKQGRADKNSALIALSQNLRKMAQNENLEIDETFRNMNGMQWQLGIMEKAFLGDFYGGRTPPRIFVEVVDIYKENQQEFQSILEEAHRMLNNNCTDVLKSAIDEDDSIIAHILGREHEDFISFCTESGIKSPTKLRAVDYIAFRSKYGASKDYISDIKDKLSNYVEIGLEHTAAKVEESESNSVILIQTIKENEIDDKQGQAHLRNASLPYDIHLPLYQVLEIDSPELFCDISIESIGFNKRTNAILMQNKRTSIEDILRCSIIQIFDLQLIARSSIGKIVSKIKEFVSADMKSLEVKLRQTSVPFAKLFKVDYPEQYKDVLISSISFSVRFYNALQKNKVADLFTLLNLSIDDLRKWGGLGDGSIFDAAKKLYDFLEDSNKELVRKKGTIKLNIAERFKIKSVIDSVLTGETVDLSGLSKKESATLDIYFQAIEDCGNEFYYSVLAARDAYKAISDSICSFFDDCIALSQKKKSIYDIYCGISAVLKEKSVKLLTDAYYIRNNDNLRSFWGSLPVEYSLIDLWKYISNNDKELKAVFYDIERFLIWVRRLDLSKIAEQIFSKEALSGQYKADEDLKDKYLVALEMRANGETLEDIGALINATRERVRQIEKKYTRQFAIYYNNSQYDLLAIIHALRGGDHVLCYEEVVENIGQKYTQLLWLILSKGLLDNNLYKYSKGYNTVIFTSSEEEEKSKLNLAIHAMPNYFLAEQFESIIGNISSEYNVHKELLQMDIERKFHLYGTMYSKEAITVAFMCGYILKNKFPNGFKIGIQEETNRFRTYLIETFGTKGEMTNRAIEAKVGSIGVLCDRGKYVHADFINVDKSIIDAVNEFIENSSKDVLTYSEIFESMQAMLDGTQITNRFSLQGVLRLYGCKFAMTRDYVAKESGKSLTDEFENFARTRGEFSKLDFFVEFPAMTDANLGMLLGRCRNVLGIDYGMYMHASLLNLCDDDYIEIRNYLNISCADIPIDARYLFDEFSNKYIDFMLRNNINGHNKLFGILSYMFEGEFVFSRPYISKNNNESMNKKSIVLRRLEDYNTIDIEEVVEICNENNLRYSSIPGLIKKLSPEFVRINETTLMRLEQTGITNDIILAVAHQIAELIVTNNYYSSSIIDDFLFFPTLTIEWNPYLLESVIELCGDIIHIIKIPMKSYTTLTSIFVGEEYAEDDYQSFILKVLDEAYNKAFFTTKSEMREWLSERGLITNNSLPNFLEGTNYYFMDKNGVLRKRG